MANVTFSLGTPSLYARLVAGRPHLVMKMPVSSPSLVVRAAPASSSSSSRRSSSSSASAKSTASTSAAPKTGRAGGLNKPVDISPTLQEFVGARQASRAGTMKIVWAYIKEHNLQSEADKRLIVCDDKLKGLLGKDKVNFLEIAKLLNVHFVSRT